MENELDVRTIGEVIRDLQNRLNEVKEDVIGMDGLTNADKIRFKMDNVELAIFLEMVKYDGLFKEDKYPSSKYGWLAWLEEESEGREK